MTSIDEIVRELSGLMEKIPEGPYFAAEDEARDAPAHTNSGLAMVDAGRTSEWPAARLIEWSMARVIAAFLTHGHVLLSALSRSRRMEEALRKDANAFDLAAQKLLPTHPLLSAGLYKAADEARAALEDT